MLEKLDRGTPVEDDTADAAVFSDNNSSRSAGYPMCSCCGSTLDALENVRYCEVCKELCCASCVSHNASDLLATGESSVMACEECYKIAAKSQRSAPSLYRLFSLSQNFDSFRSSVETSEWGILNDLSASGSQCVSIDDFMVSEDDIPECLRLFVDNQRTYRPTTTLNVKEMTESTIRQIVKLEFLATGYLEKIVSCLVARFQLDHVWGKIALSVVCKAVRSVIPRTSYGDENNLEAYVNIVQFEQGHQCESEFINGVALNLASSDFINITPSESVRVFVIDALLSFNEKLVASDPSFSSIFSFADINSSEELLQFERDFVMRLISNKPDLIVSTHSIGEHVQALLRENHISFIMNCDVKKAKLICRGANTRMLRINDMKGAAPFSEFINTFSGCRVVNSDPSSYLMLSNSKPCGSGVISLWGDKNKRVRLLVRTLMYISYNLSLEMSFLSQTFCTYTDEYCRSASGTKPLGDTRKKLRRYLSTGSLSNLGQDHIFNLSPFVESVDWQESLRLSGPRVSVEFGAEELKDIVNEEKENMEHVKHLFPRSFKVSELLVDKNGTVVGAQSSEPISIALYTEKDHSLGTYLSQKCFSNSNPPSQSVCFHHGGGQVMVEIFQLPLSLDIMSEGTGSPSDAIYMWSSCSSDECQRRSTPVVAMTNRTYNLSFARFLEMMFSNRHGVSRVSTCQHAFYHNQVLFFGKGNLVACFQHKRVHRYNLVPNQFVKYDTNYQKGFRKVCAQNLRASALLMMGDVADVVSESRRHYSLCSNFRDVLELEILIKQHMKELDQLINHMLESDHSLLEISSLAKDLIAWKDAVQCLLQALSPRPYPCVCRKMPERDDVKSDEPEFDTHRRRRKQSQCPKHRSRSESPSRGDDSCPLQGMQQLFFKLNRQDHTVDEEMSQGFVPYSSLGFYTFIKVFNLPPEARINMVKQVALPLASITSSVFTGYFNIPKSIGGVTVPIYLEQPSSWIANSMCSFPYLSAIHEIPVPELRRMNLSVREALSRFDLSEPSSLVPDQEAVLEILDGKQVGSFDYYCDNVGESKTTRFYVRHFFPRQFFALRQRYCGGEFQFVQSLANCFDWKASGGKSKATFSKTLDDRYVLKSISEKEFSMFLEVGLEYFGYLSDSIVSKKSTCLVKILGMFELASRDSMGNFTETQYVVVMPNLFYSRKLTHVFDLKGSHRGRFVAQEESSAVLQDGNFVKYNRGFPLSMTSSSISSLQQGLQNDTAFLSAMGIMDYSLLVGIDEENYEVVVGIIDYFRQYTIDKKLESHVKSVATLFGKGTPTVIPPDMYRERILNAMQFNFMAPPSRTVSQSIV
jgi:hypothetical protein